jgi:hypothetical protein
MAYNLHESCEKANFVFHDRRQLSAARNFDAPVCFHFPRHEAEGKDTNIMFPAMDMWIGGSYWFSRFCFQRALGLIYFIAFLVALNQFRPLLGEHGLEPVPRFLKVVRFREAPSIFHWRYSDRLFGAVATAGLVLSFIAMVGLSDIGPLWWSIIVWFMVWVLYLSIVNVGQTFYGFGWESLLLEAGFFAIWLGPAQVASPFLVILLLRWVLFRVEFGAGLIKLRGDPCWRDLTCLYYHYETQPLPNPLSWYAHHLPKGFHRASVLVNHFAQLVAPLILFAPPPFAALAGLVMIGTQAWLILTGNYSWLNYITIVLAFSAFDDGTLRAVLPIAPPATEPRPWPYEAAIYAVTALAVALSVKPVRNMLSRRQLMNYSFNPFHLVNTYGAFGSVTRKRLEIVLEGTTDPAPGPRTQWKEYAFKGKPGDPHRRPPVVAPYHWRLDWQMWFLPMMPYRYPAWVIALIARLLANDPATLRLFAHNPFPDRAPCLIRARMYHYRFATPAEKRATGNWWTRTDLGDYLPPVALQEEEELTG